MNEEYTHILPGAPAYIGRMLRDSKPGTSLTKDMVCYYSLLGGLRDMLDDDEAFFTRFQSYFLGFARLGRPDDTTAIPPLARKLQTLVYRLRPGLLNILEDQPKLDILKRKRLDEFGFGWRLSGFSRVLIGHKLCASLALTDVPDLVEVRAPFNHWVVSVPPVFGDWKVKYVFCEDADPVGFATQETDESNGSTYLSHSWFPECFLTNTISKLPAFAERWRSLLQSVVRSTCLAMSEPEQFRRTRSYQSSGKAGAKVPDFNTCDYMVSRDVQIDAREALADYMSSEVQSSKPKHTFLVRGHWRSQPCGPGRELRANALGVGHVELGEAHLARQAERCVLTELPMAEAKARVALQTQTDREREKARVEERAHTLAGFCLPKRGPGFFR